MKASTLFFFLALFQCAFGQNLDTFLEQYVDNTNDWPVYSNEKKSFRMVNGTYVFASKQKATRSGVYKNYLVDRHQSFLVEAAIKYTKGKKSERYGLLLGYFNWDNYAAFEIDQKNRFTIYQVRNGKRTYLTRDQDLGFSLNADYDVLQLKKLNGKYEFLVNENLVASYADLNFIGTSFGYLLNDNQEIQVDFLQIHAMNLNVKFEPIVSGQLENLGPNINSPYTEKSPIVSANGKTMYFTVAGDPKLNLVRKTDDAAWSKLDINGNWTPRTLLPGRVNNASYNFLISIAPDENYAFFGNVYGADGSMSKGLSTAYKVNGAWTLPEQVIINGFKNEFPR